MRQSSVSPIRGAVLGDAQSGPPRFTDGCYVFGPEFADLHLPEFHQLISDTTLSSPEEGNPLHVLSERLALRRLPPIVTPESISSQDDTLAADQSSFINVVPAAHVQIIEESGIEVHPVSQAFELLQGP